MNLAEAARTGWREIATNKFRSGLSFAAISVGVASLIYTMAQTRGMQESLDKAITLLGPGRLEISPKENYTSRGLSHGLTSDDAWAIRRSMPEFHMVYPQARHWGARMRRGSTIIEHARVEGTSPEWRKRDWVYTLRGRFLNNWDITHAARVCVLIEPGGWIKKPFWAYFWNDDSPFNDLVVHNDLLGEQIMLGERLFTVVGILRSPPRDKDPRWYSWETPEILMPVTAFHHTFRDSWNSVNNPRAVSSIKLDTGSLSTVASAQRRLRALLQYRHRGEEDFEIKDLREEIAGELSETQKYVMAGIALGTVALLAGGIGIMNVTLATIFARVKEIGVRRALGASRQDILAQFLVEAVFLGLTGGLAGVGLGIWSVSILSQTTSRDVASMAWYHSAAAMGLAAAVSGLFSLYPAYQASRLDPVEALRSEQ